MVATDMSFHSIKTERKINFQNIVNDVPPGLTHSNLIAFTLGYKSGYASVNTGDGITWGQMADSKLSFSNFVRKAAGNNTNSPEYRELYRFLLKCFTDADQDFDGKIELSEFSSMIDQASAAPRKWGFAPSCQELYGGGESADSGYSSKVIAARTKMFEVMSKGTDYIPFDIWLSFCYDHICKKVLEMEREGATATLPVMARSREDFVGFIKGAVSSTHSAEYKELYDFLLTCFVRADINNDGLVGPLEFDNLIELAATAPRRFGFAPSTATLFGGDQKKRLDARRAMLLEMDTDQNGTISFDEWLNFAYSHICEKAKALV